MRDRTDTQSLRVGILKEMATCLLVTLGFFSLEAVTSTPAAVLAQRAGDDAESAEADDVAPAGRVFGDPDDLVEAVRLVPAHGGFHEPAFLYWVSPAEAELRRSTSLVQQNQPGPVIAAAEDADITRQHSSARLAQEIHQARARLEPWATTTYVRQLDETLRSCGLASAGPAAKARAGGRPPDL